MFDLTALRLAADTVYQSMPPTPQLAWPLLAEQLGCAVWVKHENHTPTGAFKMRGGMLYVQGLLAREPLTKGLVTATRGNHGQSLALAAQRNGLKISIVVPDGNSRG
ncbi:pyridoxal-phosphate dependent enzyme, partial [Pseudomonas endophytica]|uniref:pyridoxal-phosphate dependent enzyme n=1 Tax=Pseudomonas endophytica TaxID=1563157 RepID=UPI000A572F58